MSTNEEIVLLERVLLKLGCTDTDEQLEASINKFLGPVLLKIDSPNEETRKKVMEILTHINKRLKSRPTVKVPLETILTMYKQSNSSFLLNFAIIYIILGFPRIDHDKSVELVPLLLNCLEGKPEIHQDKLLHLILPLLGELKIPAEKVQETLGLADKPNTKRQFLSLMLDMLLLPYGVTSESELPPGFSPYSFKRAISGNLKAEDLEQLKKGIVTFLCKGAFSDSEVLPLLIVASADTRFSIATTAIQELSKIGNSLDWTSAELTAPLYTLISGNGSKIPDRKTTPTNTRVRQKMIQYLLKCRGAGLNTAKGIQVIFESLFGTNTNQKSKVLALQFTDVLILHSDRELIKKLSVVLLTGLSKLIGPETQEPTDVQNNAYNAIARLATVCPDTMNKDVNLIVKYFENLHHAPPEMHSYIREALVALAQAFAWEQVSTTERMDVDTPSSSSATSNCYSFTPDKNQILLIGLLAEKAESKSTIVQNIASVFLTTCFPDYYVPARYLLLMIAGSSPMLHEMVTSYLYGNSKKDNINYAYVTTVDNPTAANEKQTNLLTAEQRFIILPSFKEMVKYVHEKAEKKSTISEKHSGKMHLAYTYDMFTEILEYLRLCLWFSAGITEYPSEEEKNKRIGHYLRQLFDQNETKYVEMYNELTKCMVISRKGPVELGCMWDMIGAAPELIVPFNIDLLEPLKFGLGEISENERTLIAKIYGTILAYGISDDTEFHKYVDDLLLFQSRSFENQHGSILGVSHAMFRKLTKLKKENRVRFETISNWPPFVRTIETLVTLLVSPHYLMLKASIEGIGLIGSVLPLPLKEEEENIQLEDSEVAQLTKQYLLKTLFKNLRSAHSRGQISEQSALCLGYLTNGDEKYFTKKVLQGFLDLIKLTKNPSIHIAIAQSLVITMEGKSIVDTTETDAAKYQTSDETFDWLLEEIIKIVPNPHPNSRQAAAFFLLALVKNCSARAPIQKRRHILQDAFIDLLSEDNEMVQDLASRGLGLIYSMCDSGTQEQLSNVLLEKLTGNKKQVMKVTEDTKVFEEGVLGNAPTGGSLSTYKELCALASDLNQPEMIYQFMQLANHNATFNSKLGAAFGIKSISKVAKISMQEHLGKIVPRLFRYKYDPTPKIQNSMISIWESVVVDSKATIEKYYWEILDDVLNNLTSSDWRTRMSCCLGARDLIKRPQGLKLRSDDRTPKPSNSMDTDMSVPEPELLFLWQQLFRVMDDYHEGTRQAAEGTVKLLSKVCVVAASSGHGKSGMNVSSSILPFILESGVTHNVAEIRQLSIKTVSELIESSGSLIQPHLDILIPCLLKATGELDSVKLSYLSNMFGSDSRTQEAVDTIRADMAKQHHTMDALNRCIRFVDYAALEKMTPAIIDIMKTTVQLGTKVACAHFICLVSVHLGNQMTPLSGKYLSACLSGISDRNPTVKKYYASAIGHLVGIAKDQSILKLFEKLTDAYFDPESNKAKAIPLVIHAIHKKYPELLKDFSGEIIPLIFVAIHEEVTEESRQNVENWKDVFHEVSAGDVGIKFNLEKICNRLEQCFQSQVFTVKAQSARSINTLATRLNKDLSDDDRRKLINLLINNITGRTYKGKENILEALASLSKHWKTDDSNLHIRVIDAVMKEARKKENPVYKTHALKAIGNILEALEEDRFEELYNMVWFIMDKTNLSFDGDDDDDNNTTMTADEKNKQMLILGNLKEAVCEALGKAWPLNSIETQQKYQLMFAQKCTNCLQSNTRQVQLSLMAALGKFVEKLHILNVSDQVDPQEKKVKLDANAKDLDEIMSTVLKAITDVSNIPHSGLRKEALNIILSLLKKLQALKDSKNHLSLVKQTFLQILPNFQKDNSPEIKCRLKEIEEKIK
ncbi:proteasome-associated protein ECM29 homolog [Culicoides brevitarsis]|uniref:proteasome-associated protein ECM29 homolog n=1 Tax=Culicoides brevitarsis TaxID=469753 RepID=UPI00307BDEEA